MKRTKVLCLILAFAILIGSISLLQMNALETKAEEGRDTLIAMGSSGWKYLVIPSNVMGQVPQSDDSWVQNAAMPIGYGNSATITENLNNGGTKLTDRCLAVVAEKKINIPSLEGITEFMLDADIDDAAVVFINGTEAALLNAKQATTPESSDVAYGYHKISVVNDPFDSSQFSKSRHRDVSIGKNLFQTGENVITVLLLNDRKDSSDIYVNLGLSAVKGSGLSEDPTPSGTKISRGDEWLWLKNGSGSAWLTEEFMPTSAWKKDATPIGYGYPGVNSDLAKPCKNVYLRRLLVIEDLSKVSTVKMNLWLDDSATVYFNGVQAHPTFNEGGTVNKDAYDTGVVKVLPNGLKQGVNVISVNLINVTESSSDIYFDMTLETSEEDIGFQGNKFAMTYGKDATEMGYTWYTPYVRPANDIYFVPNTAAEETYSTQLEGKINGSGGRYHDGTAKSIYKIPLENARTQATLVIDISQNYTIELSSDGSNWGPMIADPALAGVGECGGNRHKEVISVYDYISSGSDFVYVRIGDQTPENGWGGIVFSMNLTGGEYPPANISGAAVKLVKKADLINGEMPADAVIFDGVTKIVDGSSLSNQVEVTGLERNTEYAYVFGNKNTNQWSSVYTFMTKSGGNEYKALFIGDPQIGGSGNDVSDGIGFNNNLNKALDFWPEASFILSAGDQVDHIRETEYEALLKAEKLKNYPFTPTYGNHDAHDPNFQNHYNLPNMTTKAQTGSGGDFYFSYGNTLIMVINANSTNVAEHKLAIQEAVDSHPDAKWRVVLTHHDMYGAGQHAAKTSMTDSTASIKLRMTLAPILEEYKFDLVLNGHDHTYARSHFMKDQQAQLNQVTDSNGAFIMPDGILYITASCSSTAKFYDLVGNPTYIAKKADIRVPQFTTLDVTDSSFEIVTYRSDNMTEIDRVTIRKNASAESLAKLVEDAEQMESQDYTADSFAVLQTALTEAKAVLGLTGATQEQINDAYKTLTEAMSALVSRSKLKEDLQAKLSEAETLLKEAKVGSAKGEYSQKDVDSFKAEIEGYQAILAKENVTDAELQETLDKVTAAIQNFQAKANKKDQKPDVDHPDPDKPDIPGTGDSSLFVPVSLVGITTAAYLLLKALPKRKEE